MTPPLDRIPAEDFAALLHTTVRLSVGEVSVDATVADVTVSRHAGARPLPGFSVLLRAPRAPAFAQGTVTLQHPRHGGLDLFMTPLGYDEQGMRYEIVFN